MQKLVFQARARGVNLLLMPSGMERRKQNATRYNPKKELISWKVEWFFHHEGAGDHTPRTIIVDNQVSEQLKLDVEIEKQLNFSRNRASLKNFRLTQRDEIFLFMKKIPCPSSCNSYHQLDQKLSLSEALNGKTIIEHPTIEVVLKEHESSFSKFIELCEEPLSK